MQQKADRPDYLRVDPNRPSRIPRSLPREARCRYNLREPDRGPDLAAKYLEETGAAEVTRMYSVIARALIEGGVKAFLIETMNSWDEALCAVEAVKSLGLPILLSLEGSLASDSRLQ